MLRGSLQMLRGPMLRRALSGRVPKEAPGVGQTSRETLSDMNARIRQASEEHLEETRTRLLDDVADRQSDMTSMRTVIRNESVTAHPPPAALYSQREAFRFPELDVTPLSGEPTALSERGLFGGRLTLLGCAGSQFAQPMVDAWVRETSLAVEAMQPAAAAAAAAPDAPPPSPPRLQTCWLSLVEGSSPTMLNMLRWPLLMSMRLSVERERQPRFFARFGDATAARKQMQMTNRYLGYVCLVDGWAALCISPVSACGPLHLTMGTLSAGAASSVGTSTATSCRARTRWASSPRSSAEV